MEPCSGVRRAEWLSRRYHPPIAMVRRASHRASHGGSSPPPVAVPDAAATLKFDASTWLRPSRTFSRAYLPKERFKEYDLLVVGQEVETLPRNYHETLDLPRNIARFRYGLQRFARPRHFLARRSQYSCPGFVGEFSDNAGRTICLQRHYAGVAPPFQGSFPAILLHRCYTDMQCQQERTHADLT
jgi:hypothetical protein